MIEDGGTQRIKGSDYIVEFLIHKGITDVFGYPDEMVTQLMDSFGKYADKVSAHVTYYEQGVTFAACGYAQTSGKPNQDQEPLIDRRLYERIMRMKPIEQKSRGGWYCLSSIFNLLMLPEESRWAA